MKKLAIINMAAFYLLLTTGMFVCMIHCAGEYIFRPKMAMYEMAGKCNLKNTRQKKHCGKDKHCPCCQKHGNYVVKENVRPDFVHQAGDAVFIAYYPLFFNNEVNFVASKPITNLFANAPPGRSGRQISIIFRSLQV